MSDPATSALQSEARLGVKVKPGWTWADTDQLTIWEAAMRIISKTIRR